MTEDNERGGMAPEKIMSCSKLFEQYLQLETEIAAINDRVYILYCCPRNLNSEPYDIGVTFSQEDIRQIMENKLNDIKKKLVENGVLMAANE